MLVLSRQRDQTVTIGDDIEVTVVDIRGEKVRLGINAPKNVSVHRKEVYEQIRRENREAAAVHPEDLAGAPPVPPKPQALAPTMKLVRDDPRVERFLVAAIEEAKAALAEGGMPIGAVLVRGDAVLGRGHDRRIQSGDPAALAELAAFTAAGRQGSYQDVTLYCTLMPRYLSAGAVVQFGVPRVVAGESVNARGAAEFLRSKAVEVVDLKDDECVGLMRSFIAAHPELWNEDGK